MENKGPIDLALNTAIVVVGGIMLLCVAFPKGFSVKTPSGLEIDTRKKKKKNPAQ